MHYGVLAYEHFVVCLSVPYAYDTKAKRGCLSRACRVLVLYHGVGIMADHGVGPQYRHAAEEQRLTSLGRYLAAGMSWSSKSRSYTL